MGMSAADVAGMQTTVDDFLPSIGVIARTSQSVACRVSMGTGQLRLQGLPTFARVPEWRLTMPDGTDLRTGDGVSVAGMGVYQVLEMGNPTSYSTATTAKVVQLTNAAGAVAFETNQTVTFRVPRSNPADTIPASVLIYPVGDDLRIRGETPLYDWAVIFPTSLSYPRSDRAIMAADELLWSRMGTASDGSIRPRALVTVRPHAGPLALSCAYFTESA